MAIRLVIDLIAELPGVDFTLRDEVVMKGVVTSPVSTTLSAENLNQF